MKKSEEKKGKIVHYSVQPSEIMGFFNMLTANDRQQARWKEAIPELKEIDFKGLTGFISQNDILNEDFFKKINLPNYSLTAFAQLFQEKHKNSLKVAYAGYHSFYENSGIEKYANKIEEEINRVGKDSFEKMAQFYGLKGDISTIAYALPSIDGRGSCSLSGQKKSFQLLTLKMPIDKDTDINKDISKLFHETAHGVLEDSGSEKILKDYFGQNNLITDLMEKNPELKRYETDSAQTMVDEFLTTAFQKIFTRNKLGLESSYAQPTIAIMASKIVGTPDKPGILASSLKNGETFGPEFMKKLEEEFEKAVPEIPEIEKEFKLKLKLKLKQEKTPIRAILSEALKKGKNDPRNQVNATQENTKKKTVFPKWLQKWLWHKNKQQ